MIFGEIEFLLPALLAHSGAPALPTRGLRWC